ncbi:tetratricopeptide repeat protein [Altericroceibacterium endophyticum]|uniref:tetratricopeptide repeat protein n=1 Tax=Altericroceibacterium endophyticum TaxID=1808508 RepID=UPI00136B88FB|nr:tetratricopeptide repeat protein [Altericroceibacterium endophyticum]
MYEQTRQELSQKEYDKAEDLLLEWLQAEPRNADALTLLARAQLGLGRGVSAIATLDRLAATGNLPPDYRILRGDAELLRKRYDAAMREVQGLPSSEAWRVRALAAIGLQRGSDAENAFHEGLVASGAKAPLRGEYALFLLDRGDIAKAEEQVREAVREDPNALAPMLASAQISITKGDLAAALATYRKARKIYPDSRSVLIGLAEALADLDQYQAMTPLIDELYALAPTDIAVVYLEARVLAGQGDWTVVRDLLQTREDELTDMPEAVLLYARALLELGQDEQALARLSPLIRKWPKLTGARRTLAEAQISTGEVATAIATLQPAMRGSPSPEILQVMAKAQQELGNSAEAATYRQRAQRAALDRAAKDRSLGEAALTRDAWMVAESAFNRVIKSQGRHDAEVLSKLAYAQGRLGKFQDALRNAEAAFELAPQNPAVMDTLGWLLFRTGKDRPRGFALLENAVRLAPDDELIAQHWQRARSSAEQTALTKK